MREEMSEDWGGICGVFVQVVNRAGIGNGGVCLPVSSADLEGLFVGFVCVSVCLFVCVFVGVFLSLVWL